MKALDKEGQCFQYIAQQFPKLTYPKIKEGIFNGPQIRKLFQDKNFVKTMQKIRKLPGSLSEKFVKTS